MEKFFVSRPIFAISLAATIVLAGIIALQGLPIEQYPSITPPVVEVTARYEGANAQTIDQAVAQPLAQAVMGVEGMRYVQTTSANDGSMVMQITFDQDSDPNLDVIFTQNRIAAIITQLPQEVVRQGITTRKTSTNFLSVYSLHSDAEYDDEFLANYAYLHFQNELLKIKGVGKVSIMGAGEYALRVWLTPDRLSYYDLSINQIKDAIRTQASQYPSGQFGAEPTPQGTIYTYTVDLPKQINTEKDFEQIVLKTLPSGEQVLLGDVATVTLGSKNYGVKASYEGKPSAMIVVYQTPESNAIEVAQQVTKTINQLQDQLPHGIYLEQIVDTTKVIGQGIRDIFHTLFIALILVIAIIYLFIQDLRATLIPLIAIPVSLIGAFSLFPLMGFTINIISLLGMVLAIGLVVDDAIIVVEATQRNIDRGLSPRRATLEAMHQVASPIIATTLVLLSVLIPISFSGGITGKLFEQFSLTMAVAVLISAINSLTLSPALCAVLLGKKKTASNRFFARFNQWFAVQSKRTVGFSERWIPHLWRTLVVLGGIVLGIVLCWTKLPKGFLPIEDQGYLMVMVSTPNASSLQRTEKAISQAQKIIGQHPEVASTCSASGFNMMEGISSSDKGILFVSLVDYDRRKLSASQIAHILSEELYENVPDALCFAFTPPSIPGLGITSGLDLKIEDRAGHGTAFLMSATQALYDALATSHKIGHVTLQFNDQVPQRKIQIDQQRALAMGVDLGTLYEDLGTLLGGSYLSDFSRFGRQYQSYIQAAPHYRIDAQSLDSYYVVSASGHHIPMRSFVEVKDTVGVQYRSEYNLYEAIGITITPKKGYSTQQVMKEVWKRGKEVLPNGIGMEWSGTAWEAQRAENNSQGIYIGALLFVFLVLAALYESWSLPFAIILSLPIGILGALLATWIAHAWDTDFVNDVYVQISLVMLLGLTAKNAILVVEYANRATHEKGLDLKTAAREALSQRMRPIVMTASAFILGILPLIWADGVYSSARNTMGIALFGGMIFATTIGILLYPASYYLVGRIAKRNHKKSNIQ